MGIAQGKKSTPVTSSILGIGRILAAAVVALAIGACGGDDDGGRQVSDKVVQAPVRSHAVAGSNGFFVDADGREILFRGVNVNSLGEYWQFDPDLPTVFPFEPADMDMLASTGLNLVRLVITWSFVEPSPGIYDEAYLSRVADTIDGLWQRKIYTLVDLHQDAWGPSLPARSDEGCADTEVAASGWDGAPAWATLSEDATSRCIPDLAGMHLRELSPAVIEAWAKFWDNREGPGGVGLQDRYAAMLRQMVARLGGLPGVMGYDIMNEPNAYPPELVDQVSLLFPDLLPPDLVAVMRTSLDALAGFYVTSVDAIRAGESDAGIEPRVVLFEPSALWPNVASGSTVERFSDDPQLAYGPHIYQGGISFGVELGEEQVERVRAEAASYGGLPILTGEWGASPSRAGNPGGYYEQMIDFQDREHWSTAHWLFQASCGDPHYHNTAPADVDVWGYREVVCTGPDANVRGPERGPLLQRLARPALHFAPGPIESIAWDPDRGVFSAAGSEAKAGNEMDLFLPAAHAGLNVEIEGLGGLAVADAHAGKRYTARAAGGAWSISAAP